MTLSEPDATRPEGDVMTIGQFARATGLSVSALRFYDTVGVLAPAEVNADTGYRVYRTEQLRAGRLAARLRRIGLGTRGIQQVVSGDRATADALLVDHLHQLELGLEEARAELGRLRDDLVDDSHPSAPGGIDQRFEVIGRDFARAVAATRFAVAADDPEVTAFFLELADDQLTLVTTDRFRMAASTVPAPVQAGRRSGQVALSVAAAEGLATAVGESGALTVDTTASGLSVSDASGLTIMVPTLAQSIPDHRQIMATTTPATSLTADVGRLLDELAQAPSTVYLGGEDGSLVLATERHADEIPVSRDYLQSAVEIASEGSVTVTLSGPRPLAVTFANTPETSVVIMPMRP